MADERPVVVDGLPMIRLGLRAERGLDRLAGRRRVQPPRAARASGRAPGHRRGPGPGQPERVGGAADRRPAANARDDIERRRRARGSPPRPGPGRRPPAIAPSLIAVTAVGGPRTSMSTRTSGAAAGPRPSTRRRPSGTARQPAVAASSGSAPSPRGPRRGSRPAGVAAPAARGRPRRTAPGGPAPPPARSRRTWRPRSRTGGRSGAGPDRGWEGRSLTCVVRPGRAWPARRLSTG